MGIPNRETVDNWATELRAVLDLARPGVVTAVRELSAVLDPDVDRARLSFDEPTPDDGDLVRRTLDFFDLTDQLANEIGRPTTPRERDANSAVVAAQFEVASALLAIEAEPDAALLGLGDRERSTFAAALGEQQNELVEELVAALRVDSVSGGATSSSAPSTAKVVAHLNDFTTKAGSTARTLATDTTSLAIGKELLDGAASFLGKAAPKFSDAIRKGLGKLKKLAFDAVMRGLAFIEKRSDIDATAIESWLKDHAGDLKDKVDSAIGAVLGRAFGMSRAERAWQAAEDAGRDLSALVDRATAETSDNEKRFGWITKCTKVTGWVPTGLAFVGIVGADVPVVAVIVAGLFVWLCVEVRDGIGEVAALPPAS